MEVALIIDSNTKVMHDKLFMEMEQLASHEDGGITKSWKLRNYQVTETEELPSHGN